MEFKMLGKYLLEASLGGGMARVYQARDTVLGRTVAIKMLSEGRCEDPDTCARFLEEARVASNLTHDNILSIYDYGVDGNRPYMVMELLRGEDLRQAIDNGHTGDLKARLKIAVQIACALEHLHAQRIVHRDIKPANIHVNSAGVVKLIDFGIAKTEGLFRTETGIVMGTPAYMAPEQLKGEKVTGQADVYAFGMVLVELFTGSRPFREATYHQIMHHTLYVPFDPQPLRDADVPESICDLVGQCTQKDPADRPQDFTGIRLVLEKLIHELETAGEPPKPIYDAVAELPCEPQKPVPDSKPSISPSQHFVWRWRRMIAGITILGLAVIVSAVLGYRYWASLGGPQAISMVDPPYTAEALVARIQGQVTLRAVVDENGDAQNIQIVKPLNPGLDQNAVDALRHWRFRPAYSDGKPVPSAILIKFQFQLR